MDGLGYTIVKEGPAPGELNPLASKETMNEIIDEIKNLPAFSPIQCPKCGHEYEVSALLIQGECPNCNLYIKYRAFSAEKEIQDVIDAVLEWIGEGESFTAAMDRYKIIHDQE